MLRALGVVALTIAIASCESVPSDARPMAQPRSPSSVFLVNPEASFRLDEKQRGALPPALNPDAVERLMAWVRPELRARAMEELAELGDPRNSIADISISFPHPQIASILKELRRDSAHDSEGQKSPPRNGGNRP